MYKQPKDDMTKPKAMLSGKLNFTNINFLNKKIKLSVNTTIFLRFLGPLNGLEFQN